MTKFTLKNQTGNCLITIREPNTNITLVFRSSMSQLGNMIKASEFFTYIGVDHDINKLSYHAL